ncbi:MAG TPA: glycosyltransferase [Mycobacteriales bacterium]|nr:glycosyltransferase [Mycobacteriales bacterium]
MLWVSVESPDRNLTGGSIREAHLLEAIATRVPTDLLLVGRLADDRTRAPLRRVTELQPPAPRTAGRNRVRLSLLWHTLVRRQTVNVALNGSHRRRLRAALRNVADEYDVVCIEHDRLAPLLPSRRSNRWVITLQNLVSVQMRHELATATGARQRWVLRRQSAVAERSERWVASRYDRVIVTSPEDAAAFAGEATVIPNGVDTDWYSPTPLPAEPRLVFTGMLGWRPNVEGLEWFVQEVWPAVREQLPEATFTIVGAQPVPSVTAMVEIPGVTVEANVPQMRPYLEAARAAVVPLHVGSGTRIKALEAMASGRPVIGTSVGLEGLAIESGRHALVADDPEEMARAVVAALSDDEVAGRLATHGRQLVVDSFSWSSIGPVLADLVLQEATRSARPR